MIGGVEVALELFKIALGVTHSARDDYFTQYLEATAAELGDRGVALDSAVSADVMLLVDYAEFNYRNRGDAGKALPLNLELRIRNAKTKGRLSRVSQ